jgi:hypothetical protein
LHTVTGASATVASAGRNFLGDAINHWKGAAAAAAATGTATGTDGHVSKEV